MTDSERLALEYELAARRTRRNNLALLLIAVAAAVLVVSFFLPWAGDHGDDVNLGGIRQVFLTAFLIGVLLTFGAAGVAIPLTGQARRAVAGGGLAIAAPLLAIAFLPVPLHQPTSASPNVGVLVAGLSLAVAGVALSLLAAPGSPDLRGRTVMTETVER